MKTKTRQIPEALNRPLYPLTEVGQYARVPSSTVRTWVGAKGLIMPAARQPATLSFANLVEVFVLAAIRRRHGVSMPKVRRAVRYVSEQMGVERPLIYQDFRTDGVDLFVDRLGQLENASRHGQLALRAAMNSRLERVEWARGLAARIFPFSRSDERTDPRLIVISPEFGFGQPILAGTGVRVSIIRDRFRAGEAARELADDYGVAIEKIEEAIRMQAA
jgi:uncharacterized protein (DUF433 family)